jgi:hypothetical protein
MLGLSSNKIASETGLERRREGVEGIEYHPRRYVERHTGGI